MNNSMFILPIIIGTIFIAQAIGIELTIAIWLLIGLVVGIPSRLPGNSLWRIALRIILWPVLFDGSKMGIHIGRDL